MRGSRRSVFNLPHNAGLLRTSVKLWAVDLYLMVLEVMFVCLCSSNISGPGSVVGIATGYRLDGPGIEFR